MTHAKLITGNLPFWHMKRLITMDKMDSEACPLVQLLCMLLYLPGKAFHLILGTILPTWILWIVWIEAEAFQSSARRQVLSQCPFKYVGGHWHWTQTWSLFFKELKPILCSQVKLAFLLCMEQWLGTISNYPAPQILWSCLEPFPTHPAWWIRSPLMLRAAQSKSWVQYIL